MHTNLLNYVCLQISLQIYYIFLEYARIFEKSV